LDLDLPVGNRVLEVLLKLIARTNHLSRRRLPQMAEIDAALMTEVRAHAPDHLTGQVPDAGLHTPD
jgi:hypothetical protein